VPRGSAVGVSPPLRRILDATTGQLATDRFTGDPIERDGKAIQPMSRLCAEQGGGVIQLRGGDRIGTPLPGPLIALQGIEVFAEQIAHEPIESIIVIHFNRGYFGFSFARMRMLNRRRFLALGELSGLDGGLLTVEQSAYMLELVRDNAEKFSGEGQRNLLA